MSDGLTKRRNVGQVTDVGWTDKGIECRTREGCTESDLELGYVKGYY